jgi:hypothetical protein
MPFNTNGKIKQDKENTMTRSTVFFCATPIGTIFLQIGKRFLQHFFSNITNIMGSSGGKTFFVKSKMVSL